MLRLQLRQRLPPIPHLPMAPPDIPLLRALPDIPHRILKKVEKALPRGKVILKKELLLRLRLRLLLLLRLRLQEEVLLCAFRE